MSLNPGTSLGRYTILSKLGGGGMGEVYLAEDRGLHRKVALKVLPAELASNNDRMRRFVQEAQAAAALNHPNIAHIYEIGESEGIKFIAMEFVEGLTLGTIIHTENAGLKKTLRYLQQVAEGLAKAHAAGIVHRDLKPDNSMVTHDGYAKILDFGLSKLVQPQLEIESDERLHSELATAIMPQSIPGTVMGTIGYMSPEQAQGKVREVDHRSDIFSFGCILFEAATRHRAFQGKDSIDSLYKIVHGPTPQLRDFNPLMPEELQRIIRRCLAKDPDRRYQTVKDVALELDEIRNELPAVDQPEQSLGTSTPRWTATSATGQTAAGGVQSNTQAANTATGGLSTFEFFLQKVRRSKIHATLFAVGIIAALACSLFLLPRFFRQRGIGVNLHVEKPESVRDMKITRLTANGKVQTAAISPDGKFLAYAESEGEQQSLWTRQIATNSNVHIIAGATTIYFSLTFTPDGNYIYYVAKAPNEELGSIFRVPTLGGNPVKILGKCIGSVSFSPDGQRFVFQRNDTSSESALMIANADGTNEHKLVSLSGHEWFSAQGATWSPDGTLVVCGAGDDRQERQMTIVVVSVTNGSKKDLTSRRWDTIGRVAWFADGSGIVFCASDTGTTGARQIWQLSYPNGEARRITHDLNSYLDLSITADSNRLVAAHSDLTTSIWVSPTGDLNRAHEITRERDDGAGGIAWVPDGRIVYVSTASGYPEIWIMNQDGKSQEQITNDSYAKYEPVVSPDGRYIVYAAERGGVHLWRIDIGGGSPTQLTNGNYDSEPRVSPDGQWVVYSSYTSGKLVLWKVPITTGSPTPLTNLASSQPDISANGELVACFYNDIHDAARLLILSLSTGQANSTFDLPQTVYWNAGPRWMPDGRITYVDRRGNNTNLWARSLEYSRAKQLTDFKDVGILRREWSHDGRRLAFVRGAARNDAVLISNFR